jgi:hypothetical protein
MPTIEPKGSTVEGHEKLKQNTSDFLRAAFELGAGTTVDIDDIYISTVDLTPISTDLLYSVFLLSMLVFSLVVAVSTFEQRTVRRYNNTYCTYGVNLQHEGSISELH